MSEKLYARSNIFLTYTTEFDKPTNDSLGQVTLDIGTITGPTSDGKWFTEEYDHLADHTRELGLFWMECVDFSPANCVLTKRLEDALDRRSCILIPRWADVGPHGWAQCFEALDCLYHLISNRSYLDEITLERIKDSLYHFVFVWKVICNGRCSPEIGNMFHSIAWASDEIYNEVSPLLSDYRELDKIESWRKRVKNGETRKKVRC